ncbi:hypothetical protein ALC57_13031 [Trachymyrmex cornetzi]|uniref:Uncharacterized protein n=1 Tax=Trachymyrmex cornetzi TaxID=471704 RepID=A0A151J053_9HYME|nr:hypothetical protein ALC57_13031 [Trachymyrmex cornetzi]
MHKVVATRLYSQNAKRAAIEVKTISHADEVWPITACQTMPLTIARYQASIERFADNLPLSEPQEAGRDGRWCFFSPFQTPAILLNNYLYQPKEKAVEVIAYRWEMALENDLKEWLQIEKVMNPSYRSGHQYNREISARSVVNIKTAILLVA